MGNNNSCEDLIISYLFPPSDDVSGIVQAKRILANKKTVDVVVSDSGNDLSMEFANFINEYINDKIIIEMNDKPTDYPRTIMEFIDKGIKAIEENNTEYKTITSICWRLSNHFLALEYKLKYQDVFWTAEFSDPMLYDIFNNKRKDKLNNKDYIDRINKKISKLGDYPLLENPCELYCIVEYLTYLFADKVVFTNENQREIMLSQHPVDVYDMVMEKSEISSVPTLEDKYYYIKDVELNIDDNDINIAYFGTYYPNRHFESIFYALGSLNHKFKNKIKLHMYVPDTKFLNELINDLGIEDNIIIRKIVDYFDFLNLTTKFDILIVNDLVTGDNFKINPYLPSKIADYEGGSLENDIWAIYENGSVLSKFNVKYKSEVRDYISSRNVLINILRDYGFDDDNVTFDEHYFDKRLTLLNQYFTQKYEEVEDLNKKIKKLKSQNKKLKKTNEELSSSKSWRLTNPFKKHK